MNILNSVIFAAATLAAANPALANPDNTSNGWARVIEAEPVTRIVRKLTPVLSFKGA